jgi:hypothetical protein
MNENYPKEAVLPGTIVRSTQLDRLGVVMDCYINDDQSFNYTCFFIPNTSPGMYYRNIVNGNYTDETHGIMADTSEYELYFYLMIGRVDLEEMDIYHVT